MNAVIAGTVLLMLAASAPDSPAADSGMDALMLSNGEAIEGTIVSEDAETVTISTGQGSVSVGRTGISRIIRGRFPEAASSRAAALAAAGGFALAEEILLPFLSGGSSGRPGLELRALYVKWAGFLFDSGDFRLSSMVAARMRSRLGESADQVALEGRCERAIEDLRGRARGLAGRADDEDDAGSESAWLALLRADPASPAEAMRGIGNLHARRAGRLLAGGDADRAVGEYREAAAWDPAAAGAFEGGSAGAVEELLNAGRPRPESREGLDLIEEFLGLYPSDGVLMSLRRTALAERTISPGLFSVTGPEADARAAADSAGFHLRRIANLWGIRDSAAQVFFRIEVNRRGGAAGESGRTGKAEGECLVRDASATRPSFDLSIEGERGYAATAVLPHEAGHAYFHVFSGFSGGLPWWIHEGAAIWSETRARRMHSRLLLGILAHDFFAIPPDVLVSARGESAIAEEAEGRGGMARETRELLPSLAYLHAFGMFEFLMSRKGIDGIRMLCEEMRSLHPATAVCSIYGFRDLAALEAEWKAWLRETCRPPWER